MMRLRLLVVPIAVLALCWSQAPFGAVPPAADAAFPGENGKIAFNEFIAGSYGVATIEADGTSRVSLVPGVSPKWSPDGARIAFVRPDPQQQWWNDIYVMNGDGSGLVDLTQGHVVPGGFIWSPDGEEMATHNGSISEPGIAIIDASVGASVRRSILPPPGLGINYVLSWSPDGDEIMFAGHPLGPGSFYLNLYAIRTDGTGLTQLTDGSEHIYAGDWSPDGAEIVYGSADAIYVMDADGSNSHRIADVHGPFPVWSPDGQKIAYHAGSGFARQIYVMDRDGANPRLLTAGEAPNWQPLPHGVRNVEFTQAIQELQSIGQLQADLAVEGEPPVPIVAGKPAAMRVYFGEVDETTNYTLEVTGQVNETKSVTLSPGCSVTDQRRQDLGCSSVDFYFTPPQGNWTVTLNVKDSGGVIVQDEEFALTSMDTPGLIVEYLPICVKLTPGAAPTCPSSFVDATAADLMRKLFPAAEDEVTYSKVPTPRMVLDAPSAGFQGASSLLASLRLRYNLMTFAGYDVDQLAGWVPAGGATGVLGISDPVWLGSTGRVSWQVDTSATDILDPQHTLAHEIAHNLGLRHTNLPDGCGAQDSSTDWPYADSTIQEVGFDVAAGVAMAESKKDLMSYCTPPGTNIWISPHSYNRLAKNYLQPTSLRAAGTGQAGQILLVSGVAQADGSSASIESAYVITSSVPAEPSNPQGNYCLELSGGQAAEYCFELEFEDHRGHEPVDSEWFTLGVPLPAGTDRVALMRGDDELTALEASPSAPALEIDEPGGELRGEETISWSASDADGGPMKFAVMYSSDGGDSWLPLAVDATDTNLTLDTGDLEGEEILIRVLASDGLQTTEATTGPITLAPEHASGDVDCSGAVNSIDALKLSRSIAGLSVAQTEPCPDIGTGDGDVFGDVNCDAHITAVDTLFVLRFVAALPVNVPQGCRPVGT